MMNRRSFVSGLTAASVLPRPARADDAAALHVLRGWYKLILELARHTPTYSPPVASRAFAYFGIIAYETVGAGRSFAGQLNGLKPLPAAPHDTAAALHAALAFAVHAFFENTGPTGQRAIAFAETKLAVEGQGAEHGKAIAAHVLQWSQSDGGAVIDNLGFPDEYKLTPGPARWVPTNTIGLQQTPLLPNWGRNRPFIASCAIAPPPDYSEDISSEFYKQAVEVVEIRKNLTDEQRTIARFWSDDAMLSPTPPGHWVSIALQVLDRENADLAKHVNVLARVGIAVADAFICCWDAKYKYDLLRPVTYIRRTLDAKWEPLLITPPFPEYPSGHSVQSAAAAEVLTQIYGGNFAFDDATHKKDGIAPRHFASFRAAASEAAISRLYGGIHFRAAVDNGLEQGRCVGRKVNALT